MKSCSDVYVVRGVAEAPKWRNRLSSREEFEVSLKKDGSDRFLITLLPESSGLAMSEIPVKGFRKSLADRGFTCGDACVVAPITVKGSPSGSFGVLVIQPDDYTASILFIRDELHTVYSAVRRVCTAKGAEVLQPEGAAT